ncbi:MAG: hypothetical protein AAB759_03325 [Patescibacteria group bacterium]
MVNGDGTEIKHVPDAAEEICKLAETASNIEEFLNVQCKISDLFTSTTPARIQELVNKNNYHIDVFQSTFNNKNFLLAFQRVVEQYRAFKINYNDQAGGLHFWDDFKKVEVRNKKLLYIALGTSTAFLVNIFPHLPSANIGHTARVLKSALRSIKVNFNDQYSSAEIYDIFSRVFDKDFYTQARLNVADFSHYSRQQQISSILISFTIEKVFRSTRLCSIFKSIEKSISSRKSATLAVNIIAKFIFSQLETEKWKLDKLKTLEVEGGRLEVFFTNCESENERHSFKLIQLTLAEFINICSKEKNIYREANKIGQEQVAANLRQLRSSALVKTIATANEIRKLLHDYGKNSFKAFSNKIIENDIGWSNKIFINCYRFVGVLSAVSDAVDEKWKFNVASKEIFDWVHGIHGILNKYDIDDDWDRITKYINQETNKIEWKSTFFTPIGIKTNAEEYNAVSKKLIYGIIKTILAMLNTEGGVIIIGLVENPDQIVEEGISTNILRKKNKSFFDVSYELRKNGLDLDGLKRRVQDLIKKETMLSVDKFNNLWTIESLKIKSDDGGGESVIFKIEVSKSSHPIFSVKVDNEEDSLLRTENIWISLLKRADGRTIRVDPRGDLTPPGNVLPSAV